MLRKVIVCTIVCCLLLVSLVPVSAVEGVFRSISFTEYFGEDYTIVDDQVIFERVFHEDDIYWYSKYDDDEDYSLTISGSNDFTAYLTPGAGLNIYPIFGVWFDGSALPSSASITFEFELDVINWERLGSAVLEYGALHDYGVEDYARCSEVVAHQQLSYTLNSSMFSDWMRFRFRLRYSGDGPVAGDLSLDVVSAKATVRIPTSDFYASSLGDITQRGDQISGDLDHASDRLDTPKPDLDDINVDVVPDAGLNSINSVLSIITSNLNVLNVMVMTATLMMVSYIFFGKRG